MDMTSGTRWRCRAVATGCALTLAVGAAFSQGAVWVVDDDGGVGVDAVSIQTAVDGASNGDVILVRPGDYDGFDVMGRGLHIVADGIGVAVNGAIVVEGQGLSNPLVLRGLSLGSTGLIDLRTSSGRLWIEDCTASGASLSTCQSAAFIRCAFASSTTVSGMRSFKSKGFVLETSVSSGDGVPGALDDKLGIPLPGGQGVHGLRLDGNDEIFASASAFSAGDGGDGLDPDGMGNGCSSGGTGGFGISVFGTTSLVHAQQSTFAGGIGGAAGLGCAAGGPGGELQAFPPGQNPIDVVGKVPRSLVANSPVREGGVLTIDVDAEPNDTLFLLFGFEQQHVFLPGLAGALLIGNFAVTAGSFAVPASGELSLPIVVPDLGPGIESVTVFLGGGFIGAGGERVLGSSTAVALLDASL